jgi:hypothetical protein
MTLTSSKGFKHMAKLTKDDRDYLRSVLAKAQKAQDLLQQSLSAKQKLNMASPICQATFKLEESLVELGNFLAFH